MTEKRINELLSCDNCKFATCEQCEISYNDKKLIKKYIEEKDKQIEQYQNILATNDMMHIRESENKDKIIDLMAEEISKNITNTCPLADYNYDLDCENKCNNNYKKCWRKYFENKAKEMQK